MVENLQENKIKNQDLEIFSLIELEKKRQQNTLELIPSENLTSKAVMLAQGSVLTNKYSEGYPKKRYYGGNQYIDEIEQIAIDRAKQLFNAEHANVQPLSGAIMNIAVYFALLEPGDTILGMDLSHGGHLTHGHPVTHMFKIFNFVRYKTKTQENGQIDYENLAELAKKYKPKLILAGFSSYPRNLDWLKFKEIADSVGAMTMADVSHIGGLIAGKQITNPLDFGFDVMTTTTHKSLRGPRGGLILCKEKYAKAIDKAIFPGLQGGPLEHVIAGKAICFKEALEKDFEEYSKQIILNSKAMAKGLLDNNIKLFTGGTENHLILIDLRGEDKQGKEIEEILDSVGICTNKNVVPDDTASPLNPSGIRIGTPVITTRGLKEEDSYNIGVWISKIIKDSENLNLLEEIKQNVKEMCLKYPIYENE